MSGGAFGLWIIRPSDVFEPIQEKGPSAERLWSEVLGNENQILNVKKCLVTLLEAVVKELKLDESCGKIYSVGECGMPNGGTKVFVEAVPQVLSALQSAQGFSALGFCVRSAEADAGFTAHMLSDARL